MKKFIKSLILVLVLATAFVVTPALAEATDAPSTYENVYQTDWSGIAEGNTIEGFASVVYGKLNGSGAEEFGIEITYYGDSVWGEALGSLTRKANASNDNGDFGIRFVNLPDGYFSARAYADGLYGEYVYFTVGDSYKANYTVKYFFENADGDYVEDTELTETKSASIGATVSASAPSYNGYVFDEETSTVRGVVTEDNALVLTLNYGYAPFELSALEMGENAYNKGDKFVTRIGTTAGGNNYGDIAVNFQSATIGTDWAEDGKYINVPFWNNVGHEKYVATKISLPSLDITKLESITFRFTCVENLSYSRFAARTIYMHANENVTTNAEAATGLKLISTAAGTPVTVTFTKSQLEGVMPEGDTTIDELYFNGYNWDAGVFLFDSIRIVSSDEAITSFNANFVQAGTELYVPNGDGYDVQTYRTVTVQKGTTVTHGVPAVPGYVLDEDNANNVTSIVADGTNGLKFYYEVPQADITYDYNGGKVGDDTYTMVNQYGTDALISGEGITNGDKVFLGWSATQQTDTVTLDEDGVVGTDEKFYAVWYDPAWLEFNDLSDDTYASITAGTVNNSSDVKYNKTAFASRMKQFPYGNGTVYTASIRLPDVSLDDIVSISITYKNTALAAYMDVNTVPHYAGYDAANAAKSSLIEFAVTSSYTTKEITKEQLVAIADGADTIKSIHFCVMSWSASDLYIDKIEINYPDLSVDYNVTYNFNGGKDTSGNTTTTTTAKYGDALMDGTGLVREGYTFYGWSTSATVSTFDEMKAAYDLADNGMVAGSVTYYAVWYGDDWLEFNGDVAIKNLIIKGSESARLNTIATNVDVNNDGTVDGVAGGRAKGAPGYGGHVATQILMPRVAFADIAKFEYSARVYSMAWVDGQAAFSKAYTNGKWFALAMNGAPTSTSVPNGISSFGTDANGRGNKSVTNAEISAKIAGATEQMTDGGTTNFKVLYVVTTQNANDGVVFFDYIRITKNA